MAKKERVNKHPDWQLSRSEKNWYYVGDTARLFCTSLVGSYMTMFLMFQGINTASLATAILLVKIIDSVDDVLFGYIIDRIHIKEWKLFRKFAGDGKYMPWYRLFFWTFPVATILFFLMPKNAPDALKIAWFFVTYLFYDFILSSHKKIEKCSEQKLRQTRRRTQAGLTPGKDDNEVWHIFCRNRLKVSMGA